jgi:hypothetical protein
MGQGFLCNTVPSSYRLLQNVELYYTFSLGPLLIESKGRWLESYLDSLKIRDARLGAIARKRKRRKHYHPKQSNNFREFCVFQSLLLLSSW